MTRPTLWLYNLAGVQAAALVDVDALEVESSLAGEELLRFTIRADDAKAGYVAEDLLVRFDGRRYRITKAEKVRGEDGIRIAVEAEAIWVDLIGYIAHGVFEVADATVSEGLEAILADTPWSVGTVEVDDDPYSYQDTDKTVLELLRSWAAIVGQELVFDTDAKTVSLEVAIGSDNANGFRYGLNLKSIKRTAEPPVCTRLWPYGANNLTVEAVNPTGKAYIDNFDWYTDQGVSLATAEELYLREAVWVDERYLKAINLFDAAVAKLAELATPTVSYEMSVADLSSLTAWDGDWNLGDVVRVTDEPLGVDLDARIVRMIRRPLSPADSLIELSYLRPGLGDTKAETARQGLVADSTSYDLLVDENAQAVTITTSLTTLHAIALTLVGQANLVLGFNLAGTAVAACRLRISVFWGTTQVVPNVDLDIPASNLNQPVGIPVAVVGLTGSEYLYVKAQIVSGSTTIAVPAASSRLYLLVRGALGGGTQTSPTVDVNDSVVYVDAGITDFADADTLTPDTVDEADTAGGVDAGITDSATAVTA